MVANLIFLTCRNLGHSATPEEIDDLEKFIEKALAEGEGSASAGL
jgi:hypothetical protein